MKKRLRLTSLDGLRGIAVLAVIANHIMDRLPVSLINSWPSVFAPLIRIITYNGRTGVSLLFILTGFLMSWLHPRPATPISFWSKRYARLFPAVFTMIISLTVIRATSGLSLIGQLGIVFGSALLVRFFWELALKISQRITVGKIITYFWIFFQITVAIWYVFYLLKVSPSIYYQIWSPNLRWLITGIVNATLTPPFGNFIPFLDGAYWSLTAEVLFYLFYPILFVPVFYFINQNKGRVWKLILLLSAFPFCYGLRLLGDKLLWFRLIVPQLTIYFIVGVMIGTNLPWFHKQAAKLPKAVLHPTGLLLALGLIFSGVLVYPSLSSVISSAIVQFIMVGLAGLMIIILTLNEKSWGKWLSGKVAVFLGKYSYSLYLCHNLCLNWSKILISPVSLGSSLAFAALSLFFSITLAWGLFQLVEQPYFLLKKRVSEKEVKEEIKIENKIRRWAPRAIFAFSGGTIFLMFLVFRPPVSLFTTVYLNKVTPIFSSLKEDTNISVGFKPVRFSFVGQADRLGMITTYLTNKTISPDNSKPSELFIRLLDSRNKIIFQNTFNPGLIYDSRFHPFGFPLQVDSKGKLYSIEYQVLPADSSVESEIITTEENFISVYFVDKKQLFKKPVLFFKWLLAKIGEPLLSPVFWLTFLCMMPLILILCSKFIFSPRKLKLNLVKSKDVG